MTMPMWPDDESSRVMPALLDELSECAGYDGPCGQSHWELDAIDYGVKHPKFYSRDFHKYLLDSDHRFKPSLALQTSHHLGHLSEKGVLSVVTELHHGGRNGGKLRAFSLSLTYIGLHPDSGYELTPRLRDTALALLLGLSDTQIAEKLSISEGSASQYVVQIRKKLNAVGTSRDQLIDILRQGPNRAVRLITRKEAS